MKTSSEIFIRFPDQSKSFTYGVEYGRLLQKMEQGDEAISNNNFPVRSENEELLRETCREYGYVCFFGLRYYGEWVEFTAIKLSAHANS